MRGLVFDVETTGLTKPSAVELAKQPKIIELGFVVLENCEVVDERNWLINPGEEITAEITKITGITNDQLAGKMSFESLCDTKELVIFGEVDYVVSHNLPFDKTMVDNEFMRAFATYPIWPAIQVCTVQEYAHLFGKRPTLKDLYQHFLGKPLAQKHRALDDAKALVEIIKVSGLLDAIYMD